MRVGAGGARADDGAVQVSRGVGVVRAADLLAGPAALQGRGRPPRPALRPGPSLSVLLSSLSAFTRLF